MVHKPCDDQELPAVQVLTANTKVLGGVGEVVGAALTSEDSAANGENVTFAGELGKYWGYHMVVDGKVDEKKYDVHHVPTISLSQLKVPLPCCLLPIPWYLSWSRPSISTGCCLIAHNYALHTTIYSQQPSAVIVAALASTLELPTVGLLVMDER
jgi:hypothetical protein